MENLSQIKSGFLEYLKDKYGEDSKVNLDSMNANTSIFMYSSDFQNYLVDNGYADVSVFSQSIGDIKDMLASGDTQASEGIKFTGDTAQQETGNVQASGNQEITGDSFMLNALTDAFSSDEDLFAAVNTNENDTVDMEEINAFLDSVDALMQEDPNIFENLFDGIAKSIQNIKGANSELNTDDVLETIYDSEEALEYLDIDGDGQISDFEKELFESYVQGEKDELTPEDLQKALKDIKNGTFDYEPKIPEDAKKVQDIPETVAAESPESNENISARQTANPAQSASPTGRTSSGGNIGGSMPNVQKAPSNINEMNLDQLKTEQTKRQGEVDKAKEGVDTTLSDINDVKENEYPDAKKAYDEAVEKDENIDEELKEKRTENLDAIEKTSGEIDSLNANIAETEVSLGEANDKLDGDTKNLEALNNAKSSFDGAKAETPEEQAEIDKKKAEIQKQIDTLEQTTIPADTEARDKLEEQLNGDNGLKAQLKEKEEELDKLENDPETGRVAIEAEIAEKGNEETKQALKDFQAVEQKLDDLRAKLPDAQKTLETAQAELTKVNELIRTKEAEETESDKSYYNGNLPAELVSALDGKLGSGFCAKLEQVAKNINCDPADLLGMMQSESGINPKAYNKNGGATGLIQFMPSTARSLGTSTEALMNMSAVDQLDYVEKYFSNWTGGSGQKLTAGDLYTLCFLPAYLDREVLCQSGDKYYKANSGLDANKDGKVTKSELGARVQGKYQEVLKSYGLA